MPGNEQYPGAKRRPGSKKGPTKGSGGQRRKGLEGKGPTPRAENRVGHPKARAKALAEARADEISGFTSLSDDPDLVNTLLARMHGVTGEQIAEAARSWLAPEHRAVLVYEAEDAR